MFSKYRLELGTIVVIIMSSLTALNITAAYPFFDDVFPPYPPKHLEPLDVIPPLAIILDVGHGGKDIGTHFEYKNNKVCEDELAYDIGQRLIAKINQKDSPTDYNIKVVMSVIDTDDQIRDLPTCDDDEYFSFPDGVREQIKTGNEGLKQRVKSINDWYDYLLKIGYSKERIILVSLHLDYGKPYLYGASILYPGLVYDQLKQEKHPFNRTFQSMVLASYVMYALERAGVQTHSSDNGTPTYLFRGYHVWQDKNGELFKGRLAIFANTPPIPKVLIEVANFNHEFGRTHSVRSDYREKVAQGLYTGIIRYMSVPLNTDIEYDPVKDR